MAEPLNEHEHEHDAADLHGHGHDHAHGESEPVRPLDPASQSLAEALRVSFILLAVIMAGVLVAFLLTGARIIHPQQRGIKKIFGQRVGAVVTEGLTWNWPYPIGEIEVVDITEQKLPVDDFWMAESPEDKTKSLLARAVPGQGLRPGLDGALLTGDRNLLHAQLTCTYRVLDPIAAVSQVQNLPDAIHSAVCQAAIRAAAKRTADGIQRTEQAQFSLDVQEQTQREINRMTGTDTGSEAVRISSVLLTATSWPLRALPAFNEAQKARSEAEKRIEAARGEAWKTLNNAAGELAVRKLVGDLTRLESTTTAPAGEGPQDVDLVEQYSKALSSGDPQAPQTARALLAKIDDVLTGTQISGEASKIISDARAYCTDTQNRVEGRVRQFTMLLQDYRKSPQFMMERLWAAARDDILDSPTVEKFYLTFGPYPTILLINRDPRVIKEINAELLKAEKEAATAKSQQNR